MLMLAFTASQICWHSCKPLSCFLTCDADLFLITAMNHKKCSMTIRISFNVNCRVHPKSLHLGSKIQAWRLFLVRREKQYSPLTHLPPPSLSARFLQRVNSIMSRFSALLLASTIILQEQWSVSSLMAPLASQQKLICQNLSQVRGCLKARRAPWPPEK